MILKSVSRLAQGRLTPYLLTFKQRQKPVEADFSSEMSKLDWKKRGRHEVIRYLGGKKSENREVLSSNGLLFFFLLLVPCTEQAHFMEQTQARIPF